VVSILTARMLGRMKAGGTAEGSRRVSGAGELGAVAATKVSPSGGPADACAAIATPDELANTSATNDALAPAVNLLTRKSFPR